MLYCLLKTDGSCSETILLKRKKKITNTSFFVNRNIFVLEIKMAHFENTVLERANQGMDFPNKINAPDGKKWEQASEKRSTPQSHCTEE